MEAETVIPTLNPRYAFAAPKITAKKIPTITDDTEISVEEWISVLENGEIIEEFNAMKERYEVRVGNEVESLEIIAEAEDENASIEIIGNEKLEVGENIVKIKVTSLVKCFCRRKEGRSPEWRLQKRRAI